MKTIKLFSVLTVVAMTLALCSCQQSNTKADTEHLPTAITQSSEKPTVTPTTVATEILDFKPDVDTTEKSTEQPTITHSEHQLLPLSIGNAVKFDKITKLSTFDKNGKEVTSKGKVICSAFESSLEVATPTEKCDVEDNTYIQIKAYDIKDNLLCTFTFYRSDYNIVDTANGYFYFTLNRQEFENIYKIYYKLNGIDKN